MHLDCFGIKYGKLPQGLNTASLTRQAIDSVIQIDARYWRLLKIMVLFELRSISWPTTLWTPGTHRF